MKRPGQEAVRTPVDESVRLCLPGMLLEPVGQVILCVQVVDQEAYPAECQHENAADDLADKGDGFLDDVKDGDDGKDYADDVDKVCHIVLI